MSAAYNTVTAGSERISEECPRQQSRVGKDRIGNSVRVYFGHLAENERKNQHRQQWLNNRPSRAKQCLLITYLYVTPNEKIEKLAIGPQIAEINRNPSLICFDDDQGLFRQLKLGCLVLLFR